MSTLRHKRKLAGVALAVALLPVMAACSSPTATTNTDAAGSGINIAYLSYTGTGDFSPAIQRGAESVVTPDGGSVTFFTANFDPQVQQTQGLDAITSGKYDAIMLAPVDSTTGVPCVDAARAADIPVATVESAVGPEAFELEPQVEGVVAVVTNPAATQAELDLELLSQACEGQDPCKVIAEVITANDKLSNTRIDLIEEAEGTNIEVVQRLVSGLDPGEIDRNLPAVLTANPDADVFISVTDLSALTAAKVIDTAGLSDQIKSIGLGGSSEGAAGVADGTIFATIGNWPQQYGAFAAAALVKAVAGEEISPVSLNMLEADTPQLVTKDTVAEFTPEWGAGT